MKEVTFKIEGGFDIPDNFEPQHAANGDIVGYKTPKGEVLRLVMAIEVEDTKNNFKYLASDNDLSAYNICCLDYSQLTFFEKLG